MKWIWYKRKDKTIVLKWGNWKVLEIKKKSNGQYSFYSCLVFNHGEMVASEGIHGSYLGKKYKAVRWGCKKARELNIIK